MLGVGGVTPLVIFLNKTFDLLEDFLVFPDRVWAALLLL